MRPECAKGISNGRDGGDAPKFIPGARAARSIPVRAKMEG
jgi:hypothetical protein